MRIAALAARQHGNVTREQLLDLGVGAEAIKYRVAIGRLHRVHRGVYAVGRRPVSGRELVAAAVLACGPGAGLSNGSAMTLWEYWRRWEQPFEVTVTGDRRPRGIVVHRSSTLHRRDLTLQHGIRVTTPARTLLDISPRLGDRALKRAVNQALHSRWLTECQLAEALARHSRLPGAGRIAKLLGAPGTPPRSSWEDEFPEFCARHGLPQPVMGAVVCGYVVDALFPAQRVVVELDSWEYHHGAIAFETDRERDAETLAHGLRTVRITWERLHADPAREARRLRAILDGDGRSGAHAPRAA